MPITPTGDLELEFTPTGELTNMDYMVPGDVNPSLSDDDRKALAGMKEELTPPVPPLQPDYSAELGIMSPGAPVPAWGTGYAYLPVGLTESACSAMAQSQGSFSWDGHAQA
jgi:hypothetical protein